jgi:hypothetical protein
MGLSKYIKNKVTEKVQNYKAEKAHQREEKLENRNQYERGYREGQYKRGLAEGSGQVVPANRMNRQPQGVTGRVGQISSGVSRGVQNFGDVFLGKGGGFDGFGFGGEPTRKSGPPMRTTHINPRTGKITINEPIQKSAEEADVNPYNDFWGSPGSSGNKKREKHFYDPF